MFFKKKAITIAMAILAILPNSSMAFASNQSTNQQQIRSIVATQEAKINTTTTGYLTQTTKSNTYKLVVPKDGRIDLEFITYADSYIDWELWDKDGYNKITYVERISGSNEEQGQKHSWYTYLEAGTYNLKVKARDGYSTQGKYSLKPIFIATNNNDQEPNNTISNAQSLPLNNTTTGLFTEEDKLDIYKLVIPSGGKIDLGFITYADSYIDWELWDKDGYNLITSKTYISGSNEEQGKKSSWYMYLEPGTYSLKVKARDGYSTLGKYSLTPKFTPANNNDKEPNNNTVSTAQPLSLNKGTVGLLTETDSRDIYKVTIPQDGEVSLNLISNVDSYIDWELWDKDGYNMIDSDDYISGTTEAQGEKYKYDLDLEAGTYNLYIKKRSGYNSIGKYTLKVEANVGKWVKQSGKWYFYEPNGNKHTGWLNLDGVWYYMDSTGAMKTGWQKISNKWYYMDSTGVMKTGWQKISNKWYYMDSTGTMKTGWQRISNKWYYMDSTGAMVTNKTIDGWRIDSSGVATKIR